MRRIYIGLVCVIFVCILSGCTRNSSYVTLEKELVVQSLQEDHGVYYAVTDYLTTLTNQNYMKLYVDNYDPNMGLNDCQFKMLSGNTTRYEITEVLYKQLLADKEELAHGNKQLYYIGKVAGRKLVEVEKLNGRIYTGQPDSWEYPYIQESFEDYFPGITSTYVGGEPLELKVTLDENYTQYTCYKLNIGEGTEEEESLWSTNRGQNLIFMMRADQTILCYELYGDVSFPEKGKISVYVDPSFSAIRRFTLEAQKGYVIPGYTTPYQDELTTNRWLDAYYPTSSACPYMDILDVIPYSMEYDWNNGHPTSDGIIHLEEGTAQKELRGSTFCLSKDVTGTLENGETIDLKAGTVVHPVQIDTNTLEITVTTEEQTAVILKCEKDLL